MYCVFIAVFLFLFKDEIGIQFLQSENRQQFYEYPHFVSKSNSRLNLSSVSSENTMPNMSAITNAESNFVFKECVQKNTSLVTDEQRFKMISDLKSICVQGDSNTQTLRSKMLRIQSSMREKQDIIEDKSRFMIETNDIQFLKKKLLMYENKLKQIDPSLLNDMI